MTIFAPNGESRAPQASQTAQDTDILAHGGLLVLKLLTPQGEFPARIQGMSITNGSVQVAGAEATRVKAGVPAIVAELSKAGVYRAKFNSDDGTEEQHYIKISPSGDSPLVANLRSSKAEVGVHENVLFDSSSSMELDPETRISRREISLTMAETFVKLNDDYHVASFDEPGSKDIKLRVTDDKGRRETDGLVLKVVASEPPKATELSAGGVNKEDIRKGGLYSIPEDILFDPGQADTSDSGRRLLEDFARAVAGENVIVSVVGHTDDMPISKVFQRKFVNNQQLSEARANSAIEVLAAEGVKRENLRAVGKGESAPIAPNTSSQGRAKNRRIEIAVIPKES